MPQPPETFSPTDYDADVTREENVVEVVVPETETGAPRIDKYLTRFYPEASRSKIGRASCRERVYCEV